MSRLYKMFGKNREKDKSPMPERCTLRCLLSIICFICTTFNRCCATSVANIISLIWSRTWWYSFVDKFSNMLHSSIIKIHMVWAKWCLWNSVIYYSSTAVLLWYNFFRLTSSTDPSELYNWAKGVFWNITLCFTIKQNLKWNKQTINT